MAYRTIALKELKNLVGQELAVGDYVPVPQKRIDQFAETTEDRQWIHIDVERSKKESPYRNTIAHGFLTLSMLSSLVKRAIEVQGVRMGINYGLDRVRFPAAVPAGSNIRARVSLLSLDEIPGGVQVKYGVTVECEGVAKPVCVAEWLVRHYE